MRIVTSCWLLCFLAFCALGTPSGNYAQLQPALSTSAPLDLQEIETYLVKHDRDKLVVLLKQRGVAEIPAGYAETLLPDLGATMPVLEAIQHARVVRAADTPKASDVALQLSIEETEIRTRLQTDPQNGGLREVLGSIILREGRNSEGVSECSEAVTLQPNSISAHFQLSLAFFQQNNAQRGIAELREAIQMGGAPATRTLLADALNRAERASASANPTLAASTESRTAIPHPAPPTAHAPDAYEVKFTTTKGTFVIQVHRAWAPLSADRFYNLASRHFYDGVHFSRVLPGFVAQFGVSDDPKANRSWQAATIKKDPVTQSNRSRYVSFASVSPEIPGYFTTEPDVFKSTTQVIINLGDNSRLDGQGYAPFGLVTAGMEVIVKLYGAYGDTVNLPTLSLQGRQYLQSHFPLLDSINAATVVPLYPVVISADVACLVKIDDGLEEEVSPDKPLTAQMTVGRHVVTAVSHDLKDARSQDVQVSNSMSQSLQTGLLAVKQAREQNVAARGLAAQVQAQAAAGEVRQQEQRQAQAKSIASQSAAKSKELADLNSQLADLNSQNADLRQAVDDAESEAQQDEERAQQFEQQCAAIRGPCVGQIFIGTNRADEQRQRAKAREDKSQIADITSQIGDLHGQIDQIQNELARLQGSNGGAASNGRSCPTWSSKFDQIDDNDALQVLRKEQRQGWDNIFQASVQQGMSLDRQIAQGEQGVQTFYQGYLTAQRAWELTRADNRPEPSVTAQQCKNQNMGANMAAICDQHSKQNAILGFEGILDLMRCRAGRAPVAGIVFPNAPPLSNTPPATSGYVPYVPSDPQPSPQPQTPSNDGPRCPDQFCGVH
jgi:peptidyl-prolyl cis-trans isomerase A (cyclophilin A)